MMPPANNKSLVSRLTPLRFVALVAVFIAVAWLFKLRFDRAIKEIDTRYALSDQLKYLDKEQRKALSEYADGLKRKYNLDLRVEITDRVEFKPVKTPGTIYIGINPTDKRSLLILPPLVEKVFSPGFKRYLTLEHFPAYLDKNDWRKGLGEALVLIGRELGQDNPAHSRKDPNSIGDLNATGYAEAAVKPGHIDNSTSKHIQDIK